MLDLYDRLPAMRITDLLLEVDAGYRLHGRLHECAQTGAPCKDRIGLLTVLLAEGLNLGLSKMAEATNTHDYLQLSRLSRWHVESDAINQALAMVIEAQSRLPMARFWGGGVTASSDGQFFPAARQGEAMNLINAKYGSEPGLKAYTHVSDQFGPFATQNIPATVSEAPYILDGLLMNEDGSQDQRAVCRHRRLHRSRLCRDLAARLPVHPAHPRPAIQAALPLRPGGSAQRIARPDRRQDPRGPYRPELARHPAGRGHHGGGHHAAQSAAQEVRGLSAPARAGAWRSREIGRIERTLFIIDWLLDADMQRRAQIGLNKGEAHHALKNALRIGRQGEIRDRTAEGQHYRMAGLNLLAAIIIYWNTKHLGQAVAARQRAGLDCAPDLLAHISPLGEPRLPLL